MTNLQTRSTFHTSSWLGELPSDWRFSKFKRHARFKTGTTPPTDNQANYSEQGFPWLRPEDIVEGRIFAKASKFLSEEGLRYVSVSRGMATVICGIGTIGKIALVKNRFSSNQQLISIDSTFDNYFCYYLCLSARSEFESLATGNVVRILNTERLGNLEVPVPPPKEQRQIAAYLNRETAKIDNLIAKQQKLIKLLQEKRQAVISQAVTKGLDPNVKMKDSGVAWLGEVPEHWKVTSFRHLLIGSTSSGVFKTKEQFGFGTKLINVFDIYRSDFKVNFDSLDKVNVSSQEIVKYKVKNGDLFFVRSSLKAEGIGASVVALDLNEDIVYECHVIRARPSERCSGHFLSYFLNSTYAREKFISLANTTTMTTLSQNGFLSLKVCIPQLKEQERIAKSIDNKLQEFDLTELKIRESIKLLKEHRQALITAAVTGKIDVRGLVTDEEVAALDVDPVLETTEENFESEVVEADYITEEE